MRSRKLGAPGAGSKTWNYDINGDYENRRGFEPAFRAQTLELIQTSSILERVSNGLKIPENIS